MLRAWLEDQVLPTFAGRVIAVDTAVARCCARLHVPDPRADRDALIAAAALVHGMKVVTRNVADFAPTGVATIDPWRR
jgi:predicted nucleic acid-binding protein